MILKNSKKLPRHDLKRILIRGTNWIGDAVMTLPAVASVRAAYPEAHLAILAKPPVTDVYRLFSAADEIIPSLKTSERPAEIYADMQAILESL